MNDLFNEKAVVLPIYVQFEEATFSANCSEVHRRKGYRPLKEEMLWDVAPAKVVKEKVMLASSKLVRESLLAKDPLMVDFHQDTETAACVCHLGIIREEFES